MTLTAQAVSDNSQVPGITAETYIPDQLIAGQFPRVTGVGTLGAGTLSRGTVLGQVTATGNYIACVKTAADGSQTPACVLLDYADASGGPVTIGFYETGEFNGNSLIIDPSWTLAQMSAALRPLSIFVKPVVSAADPTQP